MKILAIESSCDETAVAIAEGVGEKVTILSNIVASQISIHQKYGGVIPEVAAREHVLNIIPVINEALIKAGLPLRPPATSPYQGEDYPLCSRESKFVQTIHQGKDYPLLSKEGCPSLAEDDESRRASLAEDDESRRAKGGVVDVIAVTAGPGLITSLSVGLETAKCLSYAWNIPIVAVNHIAGHIYANWIDEVTNNEELGASIKFPAVIMTVSGGHNMLILMRDHLDFEVIGDTLDDAAGEAFDKAAKMLGLGYPGGPAIAHNAQLITHNVNKEELQVTSYELRKIQLPRPMINSTNLNFSFSGLKTALLYTLKKDADWQNRIPEYAQEFQQAVVDTLIFKTIQAAKHFNAKTVLLAGGVSANLELRKQLEKAVAKQLPQARFGLPDLKYTTDNAAMIASAGYFMAQAGRFTVWHDLKVDPNLNL